MTNSQDPMRFDFLLSFDGRIKRFAWWAVIAPIFILNFIAEMISIIYPNILIIQVFPPIFYLATLWPFLAVSAKRLHDRNLSGFWILLTLFPILGMLWMIVECGCLKGTEGENEYGPAPA